MHNVRQRRSRPTANEVGTVAHPRTVMRPATRATGRHQPTTPATTKQVATRRLTAGVIPETTDTQQPGTVRHAPWRRPFGRKDVARRAGLLGAAIRARLLGAGPQAHNEGLAWGAGGGTAETTRPAPVLEAGLRPSQANAVRAP